MDRAPGVLIASNHIAQPARPAPRLKLLIDWEPRWRVFFGNLADLLLSRQLPPIRLTSRPAAFWNDVFVPSGAAWNSFIESLLCQFLLLILIIWGQSRIWVVEKLPAPESSHKTITYYPLSKSFPAVGSRPASIPKKAHTPARQAAHQANAPRPPAMRVTPEQKLSNSAPHLIAPPDIKQAMAQPDLPSPHAVTPIVPLAATEALRRNALATPEQVTPPLPQVEGISGGRSKARVAGNVAVVPPAPTVQNAGNSGRGGQLGPISAAKPVPPPPGVQVAGNVTGDARLGALSRGNSQVVPPPPSLQNSSKSARGGQFGSLPTTAANVVPPAPAVQGGGNGARLGSLTGAGSQVVPPPPSVQGSGRSGAERGRSLSASSAATNVVPPPPSVQGGAGGGRSGSMNSGNSQVVAPAPSVQGGSSDSRLQSLADARPASVGTLYSGPTGALQPMDPLPGSSDQASAATSPAENDSDKNAEEFPLGALGLVFALPGTSFFSNYEVFVAKRRVGKDQIQLIKMVYEFLPYQRRLSEYNLGNAPLRVIKLRVHPDPSCNESISQMLHAHPDPERPDMEDPKLPAALRSTDLNAVLPCYRTNADDFQKAMSRAH